MNILLPVSRGPSFRNALSLALDVAKSHSGRIKVLSVVDKGEIRRIEEGTGLGAIHMAQHAAEEVEKRLTEEAEAEVREVARLCEEAGVEASREVREGEPEEELLAAAGGCDLLVSEIASHFDRGLEDKPGKLVLSLMENGGIPVLLAGSTHRPVRTVVVGCGGDHRTERAVGAMTRIGLWKLDVRGILIAVDDSPEEGQARLAAPRKILGDAAYPHWEDRIVPGPRLDTFSEVCETEEADVVVLGGWGKHHWWDELLGLSITGRMIEEGRRHLFLYM